MPIDETLQNCTERPRVLPLVAALGAAMLAGSCGGPPPDDTEGELVIEEGSSLLTSEAGGSFTLTIVLNGAPRAPVRVPVSTSDPSEGAVSPTTVTFTQQDWDTPKTITVSGVDDSEVDGAQTFHVLFGPTESDDRSFVGLMAESSEVTNADDDAPGITVSAVSGPTTEGGGTATFRVVLNTRPTANVTVRYESDDPTEGAVSPPSLTFTPSNWNAPQTVTITGVDDEEEDGDQTYSIVFLPPETDDPAYAAVALPTALEVVNIDDENMAIADPPAVSNRTVETIAPSSATAISYGGYVNGESFQQDAILTYNGYQYAAYWNAGSRVILARRPAGEGPWTRIEMNPSYTGNTSDSHNVISLGVSPDDGRLHIAFDHHDSPLNYVVSVAGLLNDPETVPWTTASFNPPTDTLDGVTRVEFVTYPKFITTPDGKLLFEYRSGMAGRGNQILWEYSGGTWTRLGSYISGDRPSGTPLNAYLHGIAFHGTRLHVAWCWRRSPDPATNHGLLYAYSDDNGRTWRNNDGELVGRVDSAPIVAASDVQVWEIPENRGLINQEHMVIDNEGRVHVLLAHMPDDEPANPDFTAARARARYFHYWRSTSGVWSRTPMGFPAQLNFRGKLAPSSSNNLYAILPNLRIAAASPASGWTDWRLIETEHDGDYFSDPLIDRSRLLIEDRLTIFAVRSTTLGPIESVNYDLE